MSETERDRVISTKFDSAESTVIFRKNALSRSISEINVFLSFKNNCDI